MCLWAVVIMLCTVIGIVTLVGLLVILPIVGRASWHAYTDMVEFDRWTRRASSAGPFPSSFMHQQTVHASVMGFSEEQISHYGDDRLGRLHRLHALHHLGPGPQIQGRQVPAPSCCSSCCRSGCWASSPRPSSSCCWRLTRPAPRLFCLLTTSVNPPGVGFTPDAAPRRRLISWTSPAGCRPPRESHAQRLPSPSFPMETGPSPLSALLKCRAALSDTPSFSSENECLHRRNCFSKRLGVAVTSAAQDLRGERELNAAVAPGRHINHPWMERFDMATAKKAAPVAKKAARQPRRRLHWPRLLPQPRRLPAEKAAVKRTPNAAFARRPDAFGPTGRNRRQGRPGSHGSATKKCNYMKAQSCKTPPTSATSTPMTS